MGQQLSQLAPSTCCGAEHHDPFAFKHTKHRNEPDENSQKLSETQYEQFIQERHTYQVQFAQLQQELLEKEEALNKYKAIQQKRIDEENTIDEYKQHNIYQSKENEASDGNTIWHKYDELLEECNQYKHENTKLKHTKDELQRQVTQLTGMVDEIEECKSPQPTQPLTDPHDMLQHMMLTLSDTTSMPARYDTDKILTSIPDDEEMEITLAKHDDEVIAVQKDIEELQKAQNRALHHVNANKTNHTNIVLPI
eukprot:98506_1